jgi:hypothetical protein
LLLQLGLDKIVSVCADGASVMQGIHKGVVTQLKALVVKLRVSKKDSILMSDSHRLRIFGNFHAIYGIVGVHCVCHRFALVLSDCLSKELVPPETVLLLRKTYEYFPKAACASAI